MKRVIFAVLTVLLMTGTSDAATEAKASEEQPAQQSQVATEQKVTVKAEMKQVAAGTDKKEQSQKEQGKKGKDEMCPCMKMIKQGLVGPGAMKEMQKIMGQMGGLMMQNNMLMMQQMLLQQQIQINDLRRRLDTLDKKGKKKGKKAKEGKGWKEKEGKRWRE